MYMQNLCKLNIMCTLLIKLLKTKPIFYEA